MLQKFSAVDASYDGIVLRCSHHLSSACSTLASASFDSDILLTFQEASIWIIILYDKTLKSLHNYTIENLQKQAY